MIHKYNHLFPKIMSMVEVTKNPLKIRSTILKIWILIYASKKWNTTYIPKKKIQKTLKRNQNNINGDTCMPYMRSREKSI